MARGVKLQGRRCSVGSRGPEVLTPDAGGSGPRLGAGASVRVQTVTGTETGPCLGREQRGAPGTAGAGGAHCGADAGTARVQDIGWGFGDNESHTLGCSWLGTLRSPRALTSPAHTRVLPPTSTRQGPRPSPDGVSSPGWNPVPHLCSFLMPCELLV